MSVVRLSAQASATLLFTIDQVQGITFGDEGGRRLLAPARHSIMADESPDFLLDGPPSAQAGHCLMSAHHYCPVYTVMYECIMDLSFGRFTTR